MRATIIVLSWNGVDDLPACLDAVLAQEGAVADLLVVDNGSIESAHFFFTSIVLKRNNIDVFLLEFEFS